MSIKNNTGLDEALAIALEGRADESKKILMSLEQSDSRVLFNLGWHEMREGRLSSGYQYMDCGRLMNAFGGAKDPYAPLYVDQDLKGKTLLFMNEGGLGDEIINIRFAKNFHQLGAKIILGCSRNLFSLFGRIPHISAMIDREVCVHSYHDYWVPAMSSPRHLNLEYKDLSGEPYLNYFNKRWVPKNNAKFKVGIRWAGNPKFEHEQHRKFPLEKMFDLTKIEGATFYSLQRDNDMVEDIPCIDMRYEMKTWVDTAEIIQSMDLIITSCTSIAHLSAAMGKPTWIIVPILPYYIWALPKDTSPWYNSVKLYRQTQYKNWDSPFEKIKKDLENTIAKNQE